MDEDRLILLRDFLADNWSLWESYCEQRGEDPNAVYVEDLGGED